MPIKYKYNCYISFLKSPLNQNSLKYDNGGVKTTVIVIKSSFYKKNHERHSRCNTDDNINLQKK